MLTEFVRDHAFTIAWFGLMAVVWFGWAQEDPRPRWRWWLGAGSVLGIAIAGVFGYAVGRRWDEPSALEGFYAWFGVLTLVEVVLGAVGAIILWRRGRSRWIAWWIGFVVALHFMPLAFLLRDWSLIVLGVVQALALAALIPRISRDDAVSSRLVGPVMGGTLLAFAAASIVVFYRSEGLPW